MYLLNETAVYKSLTITNGTGFLSVKLDNFGSFGTNFNLFVELKEKEESV